MSENVMKLAAGDIWIPLIILIFMAIAKGWSKFAGSSGDDEQPQPSIDLPKPQSKRPPRPQPAPQAARPQVPPRTSRPMSSAPPRARPSPRIDESSGGWRVDAKKIREFIEKMQQVAQPAPPPVARETAPPLPSPREVPKPMQAPAATSKPSAPTPAPSRATQWAAAVRDKQNLRNVVIATEILGPPRGA